jgi:hypothetical protein
VIRRGFPPSCGFVGRSVQQLESNHPARDVAAAVTSLMLDGIRE